MWCPANYFDPNSSYIFASEGGVIRNITDKFVTLSMTNLFYFILVWYVFMCLNYGTNVPAGLFLPGVIIGCAMGNWVFWLFENWGWMVYDLEFKEGVLRSYIILGAGAYMAGYTRMTYSLAVLIMETTQSIESFIPMIITIAISNEVGSLFTRSLYVRACRGKQMPILTDQIPHKYKNLRAFKFMASNPVTL